MTDVSGWKQQKGKNQLKDTEVRRKSLVMKGRLLSRKLAARGKKLKAVPRRKGNFNHIKARLF